MDMASTPGLVSAEQAQAPGVGLMVQMCKYLLSVQRFVFSFQSNKHTHMCGR